MMSSETNIYYSPEKSGLDQIACLDEPLSYDYNTLIVLRHANSKRVFLATDSGCSCPMPFESCEFTSPDDNNLEEITKDNWPQREREITDWCQSANIPHNERDAALDKVKASLPRRKRGRA